MSPTVHAAALAVALTVSAVAGPWMLRRAAPALMRVPRLAIGLLVAGITSWVLALLALGPLLAWILTGPALLPSDSAEICQRCLAASNPWTSPSFETVIPVVTLLALPALMVTFQAVAIAVNTRHRRAATTRTARRLKARSTQTRVHGYRVRLADDPNPFALALPRRCGGIVISTGALELLTHDETEAVLAHEHAHLHQRHHLITAVVQNLTLRLRWVPLLAAAADTLGLYQEIAADDAVRHQLGTPALASALLTLGQNGDWAAHETIHGALHAVGPNRVQHLVQPGTGMAGVLSTAAASCCLAALAIFGFTVHVPYALAALTGCM